VDLLYTNFSEEALADCAAHQIAIMTEHIDSDDVATLKRISPRPVSFGWFFKEIVPALKELAHRVKALESQSTAPSVRWMGTHTAERVYSEGQLVTRGGSLWLAIRGTRDTPGQSGDWKLVVKGSDHRR
jgi:hypothetical protein